MLAAQVGIDLSIDLSQRAMLGLAMSAVRAIGKVGAGPCPPLFTTLGLAMLFTTLGPGAALFRSLRLLTLLRAPTSTGDLALDGALGLVIFGRDREPGHIARGLVCTRSGDLIDVEIEAPQNLRLLGLDEDLPDALAALDLGLTRFAPGKLAAREECGECCGRSITLVWGRPLCGSARALGFAICSMSPLGIGGRHVSARRFGHRKKL